MKKLLFIFPHPDDESFACAGTMSKYSEAGHEIYHVCATSGDKGKCGPFNITCKKELASFRENELKKATDCTGVTELILYRFPDGGLSAMNRETLVEKLRETIIKVLPDVVITFPPDGVTGHNDHITLSEATKQAVVESEQWLKPHEWCDLYYVSIPHYYDHCTDHAPSATYPITGKIDISSQTDRKGQAIQAHKSQEYSVNRAYPGILEGDFRVIKPYEYYTLIRSKGVEITPIAVEPVPVFDFFTV
ncbi:PIG-L deacetylase family protein [Brevibacillus daliensis]|uniref:PIG-L deacetylase family protein n=1 Tax=Brevibacillus daliensis TaxID=2892995 RepID=UPI001E2ADDCB|nr:PIG-L deacetylase family protein [Brevibacillus daliensis]